MDKKDYILYVLKGILPYWSEADRIIGIIENNMYSEDYLDTLVVFLKEKVNIVKDKQKREELENKLLEIKKMKEVDREESIKLAEKEMDEFLNI